MIKTKLILSDYNTEFYLVDYASLFTYKYMSEYYEGVLIMKDEKLNNDINLMIEKYLIKNKNFEQFLANCEIYCVLYKYYKNKNNDGSFKRKIIKEYLKFKNDSQVKLAFNTYFYESIFNSIKNNVSHNTNYTIYELKSICHTLIQKQYLNTYSGNLINYYNSFLNKAFETLNEDLVYFAIGPAKQEKYIVPPFLCDILRKDKNLRIKIIVLDPCVQMGCSYTNDGHFIESINNYINSLGDIVKRIEFICINGIIYNVSTQNYFDISFNMFFECLKNKIGNTKFILYMGLVGCGIFPPNTKFYDTLIKLSLTGNDVIYGCSSIIIYDSLKDHNNYIELDARCIHSLEYLQNLVCKQIKSESNLLCDKKYL